MRPHAPFAALVILAIANPTRAADPNSSSLTKSVRVVDQSGQPIAGARIIAWAIRTQRAHGPWTKKGYGHSDPAEATTDQDGRASLPFPKFADLDEREPCIALTLSVSHPDYVQSVYNDAPVGETELGNVATVVLDPGDLIEIAALDGVAPLPIDHVFVQWSTESLLSADDTTVTDDHMRRLPRLPQGPELLRVIYIPDEGEPLFSTVDPLQLTSGKRRRLRVQLKPGAHVSGRLDESVPRPVTGGRIVGEVMHFIPSQAENPRDEQITWRTTATIREDGTFTLPPIPEGDLQLIAMCDGFIAQSGAPPDFVKEQERNRGNSFCLPQVFTVARGDNPEIVLQMTPAASCEFHVADPQGHPLAGVRVSFWPNVGWWNGGSQIYCWPFTGTLEQLKDPEAKPWLESKGMPFSVESDDQGVVLLKTVPINQSSYVAGSEQWELWADESLQSSGQVELKAGNRARVGLVMQPRKKPTAAP